jgi:hypothetical protein
LTGNRPTTCLEEIAVKTIARNAGRTLLVPLMALGMGLGLMCAADVAGAQKKIEKAEVTLSKRAASLPGPTYAWADMPQVKAVEKDARLQDPAFRARLQAALDKALKAKGYRPAVGGTPADFIIAYRVGVRDIQETTVTSDDGATPLSLLACDWDTCSQLVVMNDSVPTMKVSTSDHAEGGLMVEVLEPGTVRVLWRALARGAVKSGDGRQSHLDAIARHVLEQLPARTK